MLLAGAAERCKTVRALDLPPSASEPAVQLRVLGDFSITSDDGDDQDNCEENEASGFFLFEMMLSFTPFS
jgi:hypothetical protein